MRWLYHIVPAGEPLAYPLDPRARGGELFIHASYLGAVEQSARLHFAPETRLLVLRIDPRLLAAPVVVTQTPRGPMPHIHGPVPLAAVVETLPLEEIAGAPDEIVIEA